MNVVRRAGLIWAVMVSCLIATACAGSAASSRSAGCGTDIHEAPGVIRPETSHLSCAEISHMIGALPAEPQRFVIISESPHALWKCRLYPPSEREVQLSCAHHQERFRIVRARAI